MDKATPKQKKTATVKSLTEKLARAKTVAFADYRGLTVNQLADLRRKVKAVGGEMVVAKNTLTGKALQISNFQIPNSNLEGPSAVIFSYEDEVAPVKTIADSGKTLGLPAFKFGFFGQTFLDAAALLELAKIPGREVLAAKLVGSLASPLYGLVGVLQGNIRNLVYVLGQIKHSKGGE